MRITHFCSREISSNWLWIRFYILCQLRKNKQLCLWIIISWYIDLCRNIRLVRPHVTSLCRYSLTECNTYRDTAYTSVLNKMLIYLKTVPEEEEGAIGVVTHPRWGCRVLLFLSSRNFLKCCGIFQFVMILRENSSRLNYHWDLLVSTYVVCERLLWCTSRFLAEQ